MQCEKINVILINPTIVCCSDLWDVLKFLEVQLTIYTDFNMSVWTVPFQGWNRSSGRFTKCLNTGFSPVVPKVPSHLLIQTQQTRKPLTFLHIHSGSNGQISMLCLCLDTNSRSDIISTASKHAQHFTRASLCPAAPRQRTDIHTQTHPHTHTALQAGRWRNSGLFCCLVTAQLPSFICAAVLLPQQVLISERSSRS